MLSASDDYAVVDTAGAAGELASAGGILRCDTCEAQLAKALGADKSMSHQILATRPKAE